MEDFEKTKARGNGGKVFNESYTKERLDAIKRLVTNFYEQGRKKRYSISVDGELIVATTNDPTNFDEYLDYIEPHTECVEVRLYFGDSPNSNRYIFHLKEMSLDGIKNKSEDVEGRISTALERQSLETEVVTLRKKVKKLKRKLQDAEDQLGEKQVDVKELLSQGMQLYGQFNSKAPASPLQGIPQAEVEIEAELSSADKFYQDLKEQYGEDKLESAIKTWEVFAKYPELRQDFYSIVNQKINQNGKA